MSQENVCEVMETIDDIVNDMRGNAEHNHALIEVSKYLTEIADRIEAAANREREAAIEKSSQVGNAAEMREALEQAKRVLHCAIVADILKGEDARKSFNAVTTALSAQPRNCDVLSGKQEALAAIHEDRCYVNNPIDERRLTVEWLYAEAKGEMK